MTHLLNNSNTNKSETKVFWFRFFFFCFPIRTLGDLEFSSTMTFEVLLLQLQLLVSQKVSKPKSFYLVREVLPNWECTFFRISFMNRRPLATFELRSISTVLLTPWNVIEDASTVKIVKTRFIKV